MPDNNASFIPKNTPTRTARKTSTSRRIYLFGYLSYIVFFGTLLATVAIFIYEAQINSTLDKDQTTLNDQRNKFSQVELRDLSTLEKKILVANELLENSSAPSRIFNQIEATIAENVYLTSFSYKHEVNNEFTIDLAGQARGINPVLYQRQLFLTSDLFGGGDVVAFDYALNETDEEENDEVNGIVQAILTNDFPVVSFTFTSRNDISAIPYEAPVLTMDESGSDAQDDTNPTEENEIVSVRPADSEEDPTETENEQAEAQVQTDVTNNSAQQSAEGTQ